MGSDVCTSASGRSLVSSSCLQFLELFESFSNKGMKQNVYKMSDGFTHICFQDLVFLLLFSEHRHDPVPAGSNCQPKTKTHISIQQFKEAATEMV